MAVGPKDKTGKPKPEEAFYREVDEELRRDQMLGFWRRYGKLLAVALVLFLIGVAAYLYWQHRQELKAGEHGQQLAAAFEDIQKGRTKEAAAKLDPLAKDGADGYKAAAMLTKADIAVQSGDDAAAAAGFKAVAEDEGLAEPYRQLALIRQTAVEFDKLPPATIIERLRPLAVAGNPWFGSAGEMLAIAYLKQNKPELAAPIFAAMAKDENLPQSLRSRAVQMAGSLGVDAVQTADGATAPAAANTKATQ